MGRREINPRVLVTSWDKTKNKPFTKRGCKPIISKAGKANSFSIFLRGYVESSPLLMGAICADMGISVSSFGNYLYKGKNPNYYNLMLIVDHIVKHTESEPGEILELLYSTWKKKDDDE